MTDPSDAAAHGAYFVDVGDERVGPLTVAQLRSGASQRQLAPTTNVLDGATGQWIPAAFVPGVFPEPTPSAPLAPPAAAPAPQAADDALASTRMGDDAGWRLLLPVGRSGWAIIAGYLGLVAWLVFPLGPFAVITAELGRREIKHNPRRHGMGRVVVGYIGGAVGTALLVWVVFDLYR
ncbi:MAG TPA: DUF4339 domain-containing protein [Iamia sp.]|jgi:hypothetical protein|nr:DUF4339 domain-containing protein [Iamia sp.]